MVLKPCKLCDKLPNLNWIAGFPPSTEGHGDPLIFPILLLMVQKIPRPNDRLDGAYFPPVKKMGFQRSQPQLVQDFSHQQYHRPKGSYYWGPLKNPLTWYPETYSPEELTWQWKNHPWMKMYLLWQNGDSFQPSHFFAGAFVFSREVGSLKPSH